MTYISPKDLSELVLGRPVGDAKTWETRSVPIKVKADGSPENTNLRVGSVVYVDSQGYAVPFTDPATDFADARPVPYGVVYQIDAKLPGNPTHDITPRDNVVRVTVGGVTVVQTAEKQIPPRVGDMVNPYGGKNFVPAEAEGDTSRVFTTLGVCDGVKTKGGVTLVAVRLNTSASASDGTYFAEPRTTKCIVADGYTVSKNEWVYLVGRQTLASESTTPIVAPYKKGGANKHVFGIATEQANSGGQVDVGYYGVFYVPFVYASNPQLAALKASNGGKLPSAFLNRITYSDGRAGEILTTVIAVGTLIGMAIDIGGSIYRMVKGGSSPAKCVDVKKANTPEFRALLAAEGGKLDIEPDGYQGLFVNTSLMGPSTLTEAPILLDAPERDINGNMLIREGRVYAGSVEGVKEITAETAVAASFYGVSAPSCTEDEEVNPLTNDGEPRIRVIREGVANVEANGDWNQGDYISYLREAIPADEEEFVPHIGKALADTADGEMGVVDIRPFNPNTYIVVDCCKKHNDTVAPGMSVYIDAPTDAPTTDGVPSVIRQAPANDSVSGRPLSPLNPVAGVLTRFETFGEGEYDHRAVIQIAGYVKVSPRGEEEQKLRTGTQVGSMGFNPFTEEYVIWTPTTAAGYHNILGTWIGSDEAGINGWIYLNPHCVYIAPSQMEK